MKKIAVIGGGIVGLAIGIKAFDNFEDVSVTIFDKEPQLGLHASSRNSGVLHSGLYYSAESLKSKFSREGNLELRKFIKANDLPLLETGKLIVTRDETEVSRLEGLAERAAANGVAVEMRNQSDLSGFQSGARTVDKFLYVPSTAVSDPKLVLSAFLNEFSKRGGRVIQNDFSSNRENIEKELVGFDWVVNAAGAGALEIAKKFHVGLDFELMPFLGLYWGSKKLAADLKVPIYPVPHPVNPFLGVHLTPTAKGIGKIGPTAIPVLGREQYKFSTFPGLPDIVNTGKSAVAMMRGEKHSLAKMVSTELRYLMRRNMIKDAAELYPPVADIKDWSLVPGGIRAQLINRNSGALLDDFLVETRENYTHILNAVSPGWTSALSFADWIINDSRKEGKK